MAVSRWSLEGRGVCEKQRRCRCTVRRRHSSHGASSNGTHQGREARGERQPPPGTHGSARGAGSRRGQGVRDVRPAEAQLVLGTSPLSRREVSEFGQRRAALWPAPRSGPRASSSSSQWPASIAAGPLARPQAPDPRPWSFALSKAHEGAGQPVTCSVRHDALERRVRCPPRRLFTPFPAH